MEYAGINRIGEKVMKKQEYKVIILLMLAIFLLLSTNIFARQLNNLDEVWNYNLSRNIAENRVAYKDFNIVQMPLFFMITSIFLRISNELIVTRILAVVLCTMIMFYTYRLLRKLRINQYIACLATFLIAYVFLEYFCLDYNFFNLLLILILMLLELQNIKTDNSNNDKRIINQLNDNNKINSKFELLIGIIAGCSFLVKQTTGAFVMIAVILIKLLYIKKDNFRQILKVTVMRLVGICIPVAIFAIYLTLSNSWKDFIDYTILGIFTFSNKKLYLDLLVSDKLYIKMLSIIVPAYFIGMIVTWIWKRERRDLVLILYSLASFIVVYPIADNIHFLVGALPAIIGLIYVVYNLIYKVKEKYLKEKLVVFAKYMLQCAFYITSILIIVLQTVTLVKIVNENSNFKELEHFKYIPVDERLLQRIKKVDEYIINSDKPTYILDATAALYMIPINRYNKDFDMFLKGNIGGSGEDGQIDKIKNMEDAYILIMRNKKNRNWQTPTKVMDFIENELQKVNEIETFDVYETRR